MTYDGKVKFVLELLDEDYLDGDDCSPEEIALTIIRDKCIAYWALGHKDCLCIRDCDADFFEDNSKFNKLILDMEDECSLDTKTAIRLLKQGHFDNE